MTVEVKPTLRVISEADFPGKRGVTDGQTYQRLVGWPGMRRWQCESHPSESRPLSAGDSVRADPCRGRSRPDPRAQVGGIPLRARIGWPKLARPRRPRVPLLAPPPPILMDENT